MLRTRSYIASLIIAIIFTALPLWAKNDDLPDAIISPGPVPGHILVVDKSEQLLYLYEHNGEGGVSLVKIMSCSTGKRHGDKLVEGDKKTPEGFYIFTEKRLPREMSPIFGILAYPTDYPNFWDKHLARGGHGIWMHGINKTLKDYDSNGCIELENHHIAAMENLIQLYDTPIIVYEKINKTSIEQLHEEGQKVLEFIGSWGSAWIEKNYEVYQSFYDPDFVNTDGQSFSEWMQHKKNVGESTQEIKLEARDLKIFRHRDVIVAVFEQTYQVDDGFASTVLKRLYLKPHGQKYKIVAEEYQALPDKKTTKWLTAKQKKDALGGAEEISLQPQKDNKKGEGENGVEFIEPPQSSFISGQINLPTKQVPLEESETQTLNRAEDEALAREEARLNQELARGRIKVAEASTEREIRQDKRREQVQRDPELQSQAEAIDAARLKISPKNKEELRIHLYALVRLWGKAWQDKDLDSFFSFYHQDFFYKEKNLNLEQFIEYQKPLIENAGNIDLVLSHFSIRYQGELVRVMFRQNYRTAKASELGRKILYFKESEEGWKIISEIWQAF